MSKRSFGTIEKLASGRYRARFLQPGTAASDRTYIKAPTTFSTMGQADKWLGDARRALEDKKLESFLSGETKVVAPTNQIPTFFEYATEWIEQRTTRRGRALSPTTLGEYSRYITTGKLVFFADMRLDEIKPATVRRWYARESKVHKTSTAHQYTFLKSVLTTAVEDELIEKNPCLIHGASAARTGVETIIPTDDQLDAIIEHMDPRYKGMAVVAAAGGLRMGEIRALRKEDITIVYVQDENNNDLGDIDGVVINIRKSVVEAKKPLEQRKKDRLKKGKHTAIESVEKDPKTATSVRVVEIFGRDGLTLAEHVLGLDDGSYVWTAATDPSKPANYATVSGLWQSACKKAGCPDIKFHALRHYAGTRFAQRTGATLKEIMDRLGHTSVSAAMRYQHSDDRMTDLARKAAR